MSKLGLYESSVKNNKRKRMNGSNPNAKPEMKTYNPFMPSNQESFGAITIGNGYGGVTGTNTYNSWHPIQLKKPYQGATAFNRIGEKYFLRYLRFKGYIEIKKFPIYQAHYRLRLLRCENITLSQPIDYLTLFKNTELDTSDLEHTYASFRHNYFKKIRDVKTKCDCRITNICSGVLPTMDASKIQTLQTGSSTSYTFGFDRGVVPWGGFQCIPLDVKVDVNDRIDDSIHYYVILETDYPEGFIYTVPSGTNDDPVILSGSTENYPFQFSFFCTGYFTDD